MGLPHADQFDAVVGANDAVLAWAFRHECREGAGRGGHAAAKSALPAARVGRLWKAGARDLTRSSHADLSGFGQQSN